MHPMLDLAVYSGLRTRGNIKVAFETQLMRELGTQGYAELKQAERSKRYRKFWKNMFWLATLGLPPLWPIAFIAAIVWLCKR